jgi:hypothetical protein
MKFASPPGRNALRALCLLLATLHVACSPLGEGAPIEAIDAGSNGDSLPGTTGGDNAGMSSGGNGSTTSTGNAGDDSDDDDNVLRPCGQTTPLAQAALETHCVSCHGAKPLGNALTNILDVANLTKSGLVIAAKPEASMLYKRLVAGTMPPASVAVRPSADEVAALHDWIACGAPPFEDTGSTAPKFTTVDQRLEEMLDDVRSIANQSDRAKTRYIELYTLANAGYSEDQLELYRQAVSFLLNSLSRGLTVVPPRVLGEQRLLIRIDITDYGWDAETWDQIASEYPYGITYDKDSELFPYDESSAQRLREEVGDAIPYLQADWFLARCSKPPLYNRILDLPETLGELETQLDVDLADDIATERIDRAGIRRAGASDANRVLERHDLGGGRGALWMTYDFSSNLGKRNIFSNPLSFTAEGTEVIFPLPNGFFGYFIASGNPLSGQAQRVDVAPSELVQDPVARDGRVTAGLSCMGCHQNGLIPRDDDVRPDVMRNGADNLDAVLAVYPPVEEMAQLFAEDSARYTQARAAANVRLADERTMHSVHDTHLDAIKFQGVAAVLGITTEDLERALDQAASTLPREIISLRTPGSTIDRDTLDDLFDEVITAIGLGEPIEN